MRLRQLEKCLLQALNEAKGKILDDDSVITTLETLKQEAADISKKVEETDKVIAEIETVSLQYKPLSQVSYVIFFCKMQRIVRYSSLIIFCVRFRRVVICISQWTHLTRYISYTSIR